MLQHLNLVAALTTCKNDLLEELIDILGNTPNCGLVES